MDELTTQVTTIIFLICTKYFCFLSSLYQDFLSVVLVKQTVKKRQMSFGNRLQTMSSNITQCLLKGNILKREKIKWNFQLGRGVSRVGKGKLYYFLFSLWTPSYNS